MLRCSTLHFCVALHECTLPLPTSAVSRFTFVSDHMLMHHDRDAVHVGEDASITPARDDHNHIKCRGVGVSLDNAYFQSSFRISWKRLPNLDLCCDAELLARFAEQRT